MRKLELGHVKEKKGSHLDQFNPMANLHPFSKFRIATESSSGAEYRPASPSPFPCMPF